MQFTLACFAIFSVVYAQALSVDATEACAELQTAYLQAYDTAESASVPCHQKLGRRNCLIFNAMFVSSLRKNLNAISDNMGCIEDEKMNIEKACAIITNIGSNSTTELADVFLAVKTGPLAQVADEVIPSMASAASDLVNKLQLTYCN